MQEVAHMLRGMARCREYRKSQRTNIEAISVTSWLMCVVQGINGTGMNSGPSARYEFTRASEIVIVDVRFHDACDACVHTLCSLHVDINIAARINNSGLPV